jgi:hypothetical protein
MSSVVLRKKKQVTLYERIDKVSPEAPIPLFYVLSAMSM